MYIPSKRDLEIMISYQRGFLPKDDPRFLNYSERPSADSFTSPASDFYAGLMDQVQGSNDPWSYAEEEQLYQILMVLWESAE